METDTELAARGCARHTALRPGTIIYHGGATLNDDLDGFMVIEQWPVLILSEGRPDTASDPFGRVLTAYRARDLRTGREGGITFGPGGVARIRPELPYFPLAAGAGKLITWHAIDDKPVRNGILGGDDQVTEGWNVRLHNDALPNAVVDVDYFVEWPGRGSGTDRYTDPPEYVVTGMIQFTICDDRDDPGGTETWADIEYDNDADPLGYEDMDEADKSARYQAERWIRDADKFMQWDGQPFRR